MEFQPHWCYSFESLLTFVVIVCYSIQHRWFLLNSTKFFLPQLKPTLLWVLESWSLISCCCHVHNGDKFFINSHLNFHTKQRFQQSSIPNQKPLPNLVKMYEFRQVLAPLWCRLFRIVPAKGLTILPFSSSLCYLMN